MAKQELADVLKSLKNTLSSVSSKRICFVYNQLSALVEDESSGFADGLLKGIYKCMLVPLGQYNNSKAQNAAIKFIQISAKKYSSVAVKHFLDASKDFCGKQPVSSFGSGWLYWLGWSEVIMSHVLGETTLMTQLMKYQAAVTYSLSSCRRKPVQSSVNRLWSRILFKHPTLFNEYVKVLSEDDGIFYNLPLISCLLKVAAKLKISLSPELLSKLSETTTKSLFGLKSVPSSWYMESCSSVMSSFTHEMFTSALLPTMKRFMLRTPEQALFIMSPFIKHLSIDLSKYAMEISKLLGGEVKCKQEERRKVAVETFKYLAQHCSNPDAIVDVVKYLFGVLKGSEGKVTVLAERMDVVCGIGNLASNTVSGTLAISSITSEALSQFTAILNQENNEAMILHVIGELTKWVSLLPASVPAQLTDRLMIGASPKTTSSAVRQAYLDLMTRCFNNADEMTSLQNFESLLTSALKAAADQPSQVPLVCEAIYAAVLLLRLDRHQMLGDSAKETLWKLLLNEDKQKLFNQRLLISSSPAALRALSSLSEVLVLQHPEKMTDSLTDHYLHCLLFICCHHDYSLRKSGLQSVQKMVSGLGGITFFQSMIRILGDLLSQQNWDEILDENVEEKNVVLTAKGFYETLRKVCSLNTKDSQELAQVAAAAIVPSHHRAIKLYEKGFWNRLLKKSKLSGEKFVVQNLDTLLAHLITIAPSDAQALALKAIIQLNGVSVVPVLLSQAQTLLSNDELKKVTSEEYNISLWPEGELYDTSVIEKNKESLDTRNMKRENKLYSYQDQLMEMELRKELEAKRRAEGKLTEKLSKKQIDAKKAQLEIESAIRVKVNKLDQDAKQAAYMLYSACDSNVPSTQHLLPAICDTVINLLAYPVPAAHLFNVLIKTLSNVLPGDFLGELVGILTLRVHNAACKLPSNWCEEPVNKQRNRALSRLAAESPMSAASFTCCYPLLKRILKSAEIDDLQRLEILKIFEVHAEIRSDSDTDGPSILPRCDMLKVLLHIVDQGARKVSKKAAEVVIKVCACASGDDGCTLAEQDEIDVLLSTLTWANNSARLLSLQGMAEMLDALPTPDTDPELGNALMKRLWIARVDTDEPVQKAADRIWEDLGLELDPSICESVLMDVVSDIECIRHSVAVAVCKILEQDSIHLDAVLQLSMNIYQERLYRAPPVLDDLGRVIEVEGVDQWRAREGIAILLKQMAPFLTPTSVVTLINFYVPNALHDRDHRVAVTMRSAAVELIEHHGKANVQSLLPILEHTLTTLPDSASYDIVKLGVVVLMGNLAKHLDKQDPRVKPIVAKLISSLSTPSQQVQEAVANCLPPLVSAIKDDVSELTSKLLLLLLSSDNYGERKGAAYGLAGLVKGSGILALKQLDIMNTLTTAVQNKKNAKEREGALFAFEMLSMMLGRLFEPYIVHVLPHLLLCFGDSNQHVRAAADDTARAVMSKLSAHGVKLVLPLLLKALQEDQWRTKCGSVELLGAMAFCAPKQLSACLPQIVPQLVDVLADSHDKVRSAGATALQHIGEVIKNPEIQSIVPVMLEALRNPSHHTTKCLQTLLDTQFVHFIDAPSLALIMPVVTRAIEDRSTETRKMACQIIGNMYSLTDQKDLAPYLPNIMPGLKKSLVDPVPEVRGMSARALGAMVRGIGEQGFEDLQPWLMATLTSDVNTVNRSGAAQGLSEVIGALGIDKLKQYISDIIETANRSDIPPYVRDGYIMMFIYLPSVFGQGFTQFVGPILPTILKALADESEYVRDTGLKAGQKIINMFAETSIELLLPELEKGLFNENWRIRLSSVQLLGDLLYKLSGVSGKGSTETAHDDDNFGTEISQQVVIKMLGVERRNRVLSGLYMGRSDTALLVRQSSLHVWKVIVSNTPKTLRDILPTLFSLLLACLASTSYDKREVAARTLGDIVKKLGERVLPEILPILEVGLASEDADKRQGVCIGLSEIMKSTSRDHVIGYSDSLIPTVAKALSDSEGSVRSAAAKTFDSLHANIGLRALDEVLPNLLEKLNDESQKEYALDGLQQVMAIKSQAVLPYLVPKLTHPPVNTKALSLLSSVAGHALDRELHKILQALSGSLASKLGTPDEDEELGYCIAVVQSVQTEPAVRTVIDESLRLLSSKEERVQAASAMILNVFCKETKMEYEDYLSQLFRATIGLLSHSDIRVLTAAWDCINSIVKRLDSTKCMMQVPTVKQALRYAVADLKGGSVLPGLCLPKKGMTCLLPLFREGLLSGAPELKETSALGLSDAIKVTSADALKQSVVHITGPLIRVLGDRYGPTVRVAMLETITVLLLKCGPMLKPFLPQLQTTFIKALKDAARSVRLRAAEAMAQLIVIHMKADSVFTELNNSIKDYSDDSSVRETFLYALRLCLTGGSKKMGAAIRQEVTKTITGLMGTAEDSVRTTNAAALGALLGCLPSEEKSDVILSHLLDKNDSNWMILHARSVALFVALKESYGSLLEDGDNREAVIEVLLSHSSSDKVSVAQFGLRGIAMMLEKDIRTSTSLDKRLVISVKTAMKSESNDVKQLVAHVIELVSRVANHCSQEGLEESVSKIWIPTLITGAKEKNSAVKASSEYALITLLQLRKSDDCYKKYLPIIDGPKGELLLETYNKNLKRLLKLAEPKEEVLDVTLLK